MDIPAHTARAENCSFINGVTCYTAHLCTSLDSGRGRVHVHTFAICCSCCVHARRNIHGCASKVCLLSRRQRCISACINACVIVRACPCVVCMHGCSPVCRLLARIRCHMASAQKHAMREMIASRILGIVLHFPTCTWETLQRWALLRGGVKGHCITGSTLRDFMPS